MNKHFRKSNTKINVHTLSGKNTILKVTDDSFAIFHKFDVTGSRR